MTPNDVERVIRSLGRRRPFRAYSIELMSGDRLLIPHPDFIARFGNLFVYGGLKAKNRVFSGESVCQFIDDRGTVPE